MSANEHIDELLSGFLDGELNADEVREFERAMSADATLPLKLEQLRQLSSDLRQVPRRSLGPDFAARVVMAARREAGELEAGEAESAAPHVQTAKPATNDRGSSLWRTVGTLAALAATLLVAAFVANKFSSPGNDVAQVPTVEPRALAGELAANPPVLPNVASTDASAEKSESKNESFVRNDPNMRKRAASQSGFGLLTIVEVEPTVAGWNNNAVVKVLRDAGIVWTNPVKVSDDVIGVLNETRSINQALPKSDREQIALVLVTASGRTVDKALRTILESTDIFPHVVLDMAFDLPGKDLCQKLVDAQELSGNDQQAMATPFVVTEGARGNNVISDGLGGVSQFTAAPLAKSKALSTESREFGDTGNLITAEEENAKSYFLLVIRQPAK